MEQAGSPGDQPIPSPNCARKKSRKVRAPAPELEEMTAAIRSSMAEAMRDILPFGSARHADLDG